MFCRVNVFVSFSHLTTHTRGCHPRPWFGFGPAFRGIDGENSGGNYRVKTLSKGETPKLLQKYSLNTCCKTCSDLWFICLNHKKINGRLFFSVSSFSLVTLVVIRKKCNWIITVSERSYERFKIIKNNLQIPATSVPTRTYLCIFLHITDMIMKWLKRF